MTSISLTAGETKLLTAVITEMNDVPEVDFEVVAQKVGIKYARNARSSFKKVWDKLKAAGVATDGGDTEEANRDGDEAESSKKALPKAKAPAKGPAKKKGVGKNVAPKPAAAAVATTKAKAKAKAKDNENGDEHDLMDLEENDDGKSPKSLTPIKSSIVEQTKAVGPDNQFYDVAENSNFLLDDSYHAGIRGMSISDWLSWKANNNYDLYEGPPSPK